MRPTQILLSGSEPLGKNNKYLGHAWGSFGTPVQKQKGIVSYGLAPNRQNPFAGAAHAAVFNTWRRFSAQVLYVVPPFIAAYYIMNWATERNHYLNSKAGIAEFGDSDE
ncbi:ubiquinol--cytochrome-c reductase subunit 8 [Gnomoniopsis smithogilvyi]|uniref:Cytochrome b-c1 complex subunit 8 n=1 Tax=Gnomoniopsis smithogilvyi TaxID=1191159 RepID=A0A9W8Z1M7_9PEZI|nr:ubiquinol--cytochrome-c reductase subunit 8 [Gnomoniopsis smithogilvyi]